MSRIVCGVIFATVSTLIATGASANTVTLSKQNPGDIFDGGGRSSVSSISNRPGITASAGGFRVTDSSQEFMAWCLDVLDNLSLPSLYETTLDPFAGAPLGAPALDNIENLFEVNYSDVNLLDNAESAGFQLALWELVYETTGIFNVTAGNWNASSSAAAIDKANTYLSKLGQPITQKFNFTFYESKNGQDLVSVAPVPLPAAVWLFGAGVAGIFVVDRRRRAAPKRVESTRS